MTTYRT